MSIEWSRNEEGHLTTTGPDNVQYRVTQEKRGFVAASKMYSSWWPGEPVATEALAQQRIVELVQHYEDLKPLNRKMNMWGDNGHMNSPWGQVQNLEEYGEGIVFADCAGHGGMHISPELNKTIPVAVRKRNGWYERDVEKCWVVVTHPEFFTNLELKNSIAGLEKYLPDKWDALKERFVEAHERLGIAEPAPAPGF